MREVVRFSRAAIPAFGLVFLTVLGIARTCPTQAETRTTREPPPGMKLTTPVFSEELPGTLRVVNVRLASGVQPEENAAVWLTHIYGDDAFEPMLRDVTLEMLGIESLSPASPLFVSLPEYAQTLETVKPEEVNLKASLLQEELILSIEQPWTAEKQPDLAGYLQANENALSALVTASACPKYFAPLVAPEIPSRLMSASLVIERRLPFLARMLASRAVLRAGNKDISGALEDLLAGHRLATLLANGSPFDVSVAKAQVIDSIIFQAERTILGAGLLDAEQIGDFRKMIAAMPAFPPAARAADIGERAIIHQEIELLQTDEDTQLGFFEDPEHDPAAGPDEKAQLRALARSNWKLAFTKADEVQDGVVAALKIQDRQKQLAAFAKLDQAYENWEKTVDEKTEKFSLDILKDLAGVSAWIGENMAMSLRPNYYQRRASEDRLENRRALIVVGASLQAYQRDQQDYPAKLEDLVPKYLEKVPNDPCTDAPFHYFREGPDRARLVSWGTNRADDAGQTYNDDVEVRLK